MKKINTILLTLFVTIWSVFLYKALNNSKKQPKTEINDLTSIVRLVNVSTGKTFCTGSVVSDTLIITAAHCLVEPTLSGPMMITDEIEIRTDDNKSTFVRARAFYVDIVLDHGLLRGNFREFEHRPFLTDINKILNTIKTGGLYMACGYAVGGKMYCTQFKFTEPINFMWAGTGTLIPGMSGGPVMTLDGTLIGVNIAVSGPEAIISPIYNLDTYFNEDKGGN